MKLDNLNIKYHIFEATDGYQEPYLSRYNEYKKKPFDWYGAHPYEINRKKKMIPSAGAYGYLKTMYNIIKYSIKKKYNKILIFDDDAVLDNEFENKANNFFKKINKFKMIALGNSQHIWKNINLLNGYYHPIEYTDGSFAVGLNSSIFKELLIEINKYNITFDSGPLREIYKKYKSECYICYPNIVIADVTKSSISDKRNMWTHSKKIKWPLENFNFVPYCNILISIIVPLFNNQDNIQLCLQSLLNQTYQNIEIIVIDDCSTDNSFELANQIKSKKIKIYRLKENMGCYYARNLGIFLSKGEYITILDSDDIATPGRIELQITEILKNKLQISGCNIIRSQTIIENLDNLEQHISKSKPRFGLATLMYHKSIFKKYGYFRDDYRHSMDLEFIERIYYNLHKQICNSSSHQLMDSNKFPFFQKINKVLYISQPYKNTNLSLKYNRGNKTYVKNNFLFDLTENKDINYVFNIPFFDFIKRKIGKILFFNYDGRFRYLLNYRNNDIKPILFINACPKTLKYIDNSKRKIYILWTDIDILKEYITLFKSKIKYVVLNNKISKYLESKKINHYKFKDHIEDKKEQELLEKQILEQIEKERKERLEKERLENERLENERLENERLEKERLGKERLEKEKLEKEKLEKEKLEKEKLEKEKLEKEKLEKETLEKRNLLKNFIKRNNIQQVIVSNSIKQRKKDFTYISTKYKTNLNTLFYGIYYLSDFELIQKHKGKKWILWAGNDSNTSNYKRRQIIYTLIDDNIENHISISKSVNDNLNSLSIDYIYLNLDENKEELIKVKKTKCIQNIKCTSNKLFNITNIIYLINLKRRNDRLKLMKFKLNKVKLNNFNLIEGVDGYLEENQKIYSEYVKNCTKKDYFNGKPYIGSAGAMGILLTYQKMCKKILDYNFKDCQKVIIFEDDIIFHKDIDNILGNYDIEFLREQDVIYLGSNQYDWNQEILSSLNRNKTYYHLSKSINYITYGAYGIVLNVKVIKMIYDKIKDIKKVNRPIDMVIWDLVNDKNLKNIVLYPNIVLPNLKHSDNMGTRDICKLADHKKWVLDDYNYFELDLRFKKLFDSVFNNEISFRTEPENIIDNLTHLEISKIIEGKNKAFVFIISSYNNEEYVFKNLESVRKQTYKLWRVIYIDDASTDNTYQKVKDYFVNHNMSKKLILMKNLKNMKQAYCRYCAYEYCQDDEIICFLDGDDWLYDEGVLDILNKEYQKDILLTYGSYYKYENDKLTDFIKYDNYTKDTIKLNLYRQAKGWYGIPLRTGYAKLYKNIPKDYLKDTDGNWMSACTDVAEFLWAIEQTNGKFKTIEYPMYVYNIDASKRFKNSMFNLSNEQYNYRVKTSNKIFNYHRKFYPLEK